MRIAICIKHVPVSENVTVDEETHNLIRDNVESDINPCDLNAIEAALQIKREISGECIIDVYTMGTKDAEKSLRKALAMGVDNAFLLCDKKFAGGDTIATARVLSAAIKNNGSYDMIFTGSESADGATGQTGPMIAQMLKLPDVCNVVRIQFEEKGSVVVEKKLKNGIVCLGVKLPAVFAVPFGCNEPPLPTLRNQMAARKKEIQTYSNEELQLEEEKIGIKGSMSIVIDTLSGTRSAGATFLNGTAKEIAKQIYELLG